MKKICIRAFSLCLCPVLLAAVFSAKAAADAKLYMSGEDGDRQILTVQSNNLELSLDTETGMLCVADKRSGKRWYSNPTDAADDENASGVTRTNLLSQLIVKYKDGNSITAINNYVGSVKRGDAKFSVSGNKLRADYKFEKAELTVPVVYSAEGDAFTAEILLDEIEESGAYPINTIELLPFFGAGGVKDNGFIFVPDGSGAIIDFNNQKAEYGQYEKQVYGEDTTLISDTYPMNSEKISVPVFGLKNGSGAYLAYISAGAESASVSAAVSGFLCSYNRASSSVTYRSVETLDLKDHTGKNVTGMFTALNHIKSKSYKVEYSLLNEADANPAGMAAVLRKKLSTKKKNAESRERLVVDFYGAANVEKAFLGIRYTGVKTLTSYSQAAEILKDLKKRGIKNTDVGYRYFTPSSVNGGLSVEIKPWRRLGGAGGFKKLSEYAAANGTKIYPYADFHIYSKSSSGFFRLTDSAMGLDLVPAKSYDYSFVTRSQDKTTAAKYLLSPGKFSRAEKKLLGSVEKNGINGLLLDGAAGSLYSDFSKKGCLRDEALASTVEILKSLSSAAALMTVNPNFYAFGYSDVITDLPMRSSGSRLFDRDVPFLQMVLHGVTDYTGSAVNLDGISQKDILDIISTGSQLKLALMSEPVDSVVNTELDYLYSACYADCAETAAELYKKVSAVNAAVRGAAITAYGSDGMLAVTEYDNGVRVAVNYADSPCEFGGKTVEAQSYIVIE